MKEIINEMLEMQRYLDKVIMDAQGITYDDVSVEQYYHAILDEIGELNHEAKASWCWWKKTQAPVNREKLIEELADVWFFVLSLANKFDYKVYGDFNLTIYKTYSRNIIHLFNWINEITYKDFVNTGSIYHVFLECVRLNQHYNVDMETLFKSYKKKHETNLKRVEEGY